eukprot:361729-Prymnesium_polylepis.1
MGTVRRTDFADVMQGTSEATATSSSNADIGTMILVGGVRLGWPQHRRHRALRQATCIAPARTSQTSAASPYQLARQT